MSSTVHSNPSINYPTQGGTKFKPSKPSAGKPATLPGAGADAIKNKNKPSAGKPATLPGAGADKLELSKESIRGGGGSFPAAPGAPSHGGGVVDSSKIDDVISNLVSNFGR